LTRKQVGILSFVLASLVGPAIAHVTWRMHGGIDNLTLYEFVGMIWPFWLVASLEHTLEHRAINLQHIRRP